MLQFDLITIFPKIFESYFNASILWAAQKNRLIKIKIHNLRDWTKDKHKTVDDRPYGGGPGMILLAEPIIKAIRQISKSVSQKVSKKQRVIMLTPAGKKFTQRGAERLAKYQQLILLCGRYEGFDRRLEKFIDEKISIGDYVLAGGELPAMVVLEAVARQVPKVVGHEHALDEETFAKDLDYIEYPQYTRPEVLAVKKGKKILKLRVPKILLSGNHQKIREWRQSKVKIRPDKSRPARHLPS